jgi:hypothetical protein
MTRRQLKTAVEIVSDIGSKAFDLQHHDEREIIAAVALLRHVNGPMFDWLTQMLIAGTMVEMQLSAAAVDPQGDSNTGNPSTRD